MMGIAPNFHIAKASLTDFLFAKSHCEMSALSDRFTQNGFAEFNVDLIAPHVGILNASALTDFSSQVNTSFAHNDLRGHNPHCLANSEFYCDDRTKSLTQIKHQNDVVCVPDHGVNAAFLKMGASVQALQSLISFDTAFAVKSNIIPRQSAYSVRVSIDAMVPSRARAACHFTNHLQTNSASVSVYHLLERRNVYGGQVFIADIDAEGEDPAALSENEILATIKLAEFLDSYIVDNRRVSQMTNKVSRFDLDDPGRHIVMQIDITPINSAPP